MGKVAGRGEDPELRGELRGKRETLRSTLDAADEVLVECLREAEAIRGGLLGCSDSEAEDSRKETLPGAMPRAEALLSRLQILQERLGDLTYLL